MDLDNYDYLQNNDDNYNEENEEIEESPIYNSNENSDENYYESNQNNDEMFGVFDDINQKFEKCNQDIQANKIIGKMNEKINKENLKRLNQYKDYIYFKKNNTDDFDSDNNFPNNYPLRMNKQFSDISNTNKNYLDYNTSSNYNQINSKGTFYSNNDLEFKDDPQINNNLYKNDNNINQKYLNYNQNEIKKGFIKKSNSNSNLKNKKNYEYKFQNKNNPDNLNNMNFPNEIENVMNKINTITDQNKNLLKENKILQDLLSKEKKNFGKEIKAKDCKIEELLKENQKLKNSDLENSKVSDYNTSKKIKNNSKKFQSLQDDYDRIFNENLKLKEDNKK